MYVNAKMMPAETVPGMGPGGGGIKKSIAVGEF
jgi:hypothetical protein